MTSAAYYASHREEILESAKEYARTHPEERRSNRKRYYSEHRDEALRYAKAYRERLLVAEPLYDSIQYAKHREHRAKYRSEHQAENSKRFYENNRDRVLEYQKSHHWKRHKEAIMFLGEKCVNCGITDIRVLQINHKNGGGRKESRGRSLVFYRDILNGTRPTDDLDVRCANCNIIYEHSSGRRKTY